MDPWPSWFLYELSIRVALGFHISSISSKLFRPVLLALLFYRSYWYCQRSSHQINTQSFTGVILVEILPLFETERLPTSRLSIPDRFRPLPRGHPQWTLPLEISRCFYWHTATFEFVNTYDHLSRLCNHLWLHSPSSFQQVLSNSRLHFCLISFTETFSKSRTDFQHSGWRLKIKDPKFTDMGNHIHNTNCFLWCIYSNVSTII